MILVILYIYIYIYIYVYMHIYIIYMYYMYNIICIFQSYDITPDVSVLPPLPFWNDYVALPGT